MHKLFILLFLFNSITLSSQTNWKTIGSEKDFFTAKTLEDLTISTDTLIISNDTIYLKKWESKITSSEVSDLQYSTFSYTFPSYLIHSDSTFSLIESYLETPITSNINSGKFELHSSEIRLIMGYPAKVFKIKEHSTNNLHESKVILIKNQLIVMTAISPSENWFSISKHNYFDNLTLLNRDRNNVDYGFTYIDKITHEINLPYESKDFNQHIDSEYGKLNLKMKMSERKDLGKDEYLMFLSAETKYPKNFKLKESEFEDFYTKSIEGSLKTTNAILVKKEKIYLGKHQGIQFQSSMYNGILSGIYRLFIIDERFYMIGVLTHEKELNEEGRAFFNSFKILK